MRRERNQYIFAPEGQKRESRHGFRKSLLAFLPLLIAGLLIANFITSNRVLLKKVNLTVLNLPADLEQYSILHLSDLHGAELGERQKAIATALGQTRYSCVIMTGDMLGENGDIQPLLDLLALMPAETPKYYIPGDTDGSFLDDQAHGTLSIYQSWAEKLIQAGVILLDRPLSETRGKGTIWFVPEELYTLDLDRMRDVYTDQLAEMTRRATAQDADDAARRRVLEYELTRLDAIAEARKQFAPEHIQVVLTHTPLTEDYVRDMITWGNKEDYFSLRYAGLILAGHYNGGQWRIPFKGPVWVPELGWFPADSLVQGLSFLAGIPQYISPGLGSDPHYEHQPGRVFNPPTVTLITLTRNAT
ncbi:MAG: metallophosphoesterase [Clostridia bacterium]|nr:metallophosphoesterase [Clostridia bacterium]